MVFCINTAISFKITGSTVQLKRDVTRWRTRGEVKGKLANGMGSQYPSHYLGTWCIQHYNHYYRWCVMGEERGGYRVLVGKPEGKKPLGRPRRRWVDNIRMDLQEVGCGYMDWIGRAQDRDRWRTLVSAVMNPRVPWNAGNFLTSRKPVSFSRRTLHHGVSK